MKFRVLDVKHPNAIVVQIDVLQIVELPKNEMTKGIENVATWMSSDEIEKSLEGLTVMQVFTGMYLEAQIYAFIREGIQDRSPASSKFCERFVNQPSWSLGPRKEVRPRERS